MRFEKIYSNVVHVIRTLDFDLTSMALTFQTKNVILFLLISFQIIK